MDDSRPTGRLTEGLRRTTYHPPNILCPRSEIPRHSKKSHRRGEGDPQARGNGACIQAKLRSLQGFGQCCPLPQCTAVVAPALTTPFPSSPGITVLGGGGSGNHVKTSSGLRPDPNHFFTRVCSGELLEFCPEVCWENLHSSTSFRSPVTPACHPRA